MIGATQKSQSWDRAQPPTKIAGPVLLAGLTEVLVTAMLIKWMRVKMNYLDFAELIVVLLFRPRAIRGKLP